MTKSRFWYLAFLIVLPVVSARADAPFTGLTCEVGTTPHHAKSEHGRYSGCWDEAGQWHGTRLLWKGKRLVERAEYRAGKRHGFTWTFHPKGELESMGEFQDDMADGIWSYFEAGKPIRKVLEGEFSAGLRHGIWVQWDVSGAVLGMMNFERGTGRYVRWGPRGERLEEGHYVDGRKTGRWRVYRADLSLVSERHHSSDETFLEQTFDLVNRLLTVRCVVDGKTSWDGGAEFRDRKACP